MADLVHSEPSAPLTPCMVESPYSGDIELNVYYALLVMQHSCSLGEAPNLPHLQYTRTPQGTHAHDDDATRRVMTREHGLQRAFAWRNLCQRTILYVDEGVSSGMARAEKEALDAGHYVERRTLPGWAGLKAKWLAEKLPFGAHGVV